MKGLVLLHALNNVDFKNPTSITPNDYRFWLVAYGGLNPAKFIKGISSSFKYGVCIL